MSAIVLFLDCLGGRAGCRSCGHTWAVLLVPKGWGQGGRSSRALVLGCCVRGGGGLEWKATDVVQVWVLKQVVE